MDHTNVTTDEEGTIEQENCCLSRAFPQLTSIGSTQTKNVPGRFSCLSAPTGVYAPVADRKGGSFISLSWQEPDFPNGVLTGFTLYQENSAIYNGGETQFNVTDLLVNKSFRVSCSRPASGLRQLYLLLNGVSRGFDFMQVYTGYRFYIRACSRLGCTNSDVVTIRTAQLPPTLVQTPTLTVMGAPPEMPSDWVLATTRVQSLTQ